MFIFDDIEVIVPNRLRPLIEIPVGRNLPRTFTGEYVTVRRQGGVRRNRFVETVRLGINVYAADDKAANDLAMKARSAIESLENSEPFKEVQTSGITAIPHEDNQKQRYFTVEIDQRGREEVS